MNQNDSLYLDRARYALNDAKTLILRAEGNLMYCDDVSKEVETLRNVYYDVKNVLDTVQNKYDNVVKDLNI